MKKMMKIRASTFNIYGRIFWVVKISLYSPLNLVITLKILVSLITLIYLNNCG